MKKLIPIILSLLMMLAVVSCGISNLEDVVITSEETVCSSDNEKIVVLWKNNTDREVSYGNVFSLEKKEGSSWKIIATDMKVSYTLEGKRLLANTSKEHTYYLKPTYADLELGKYRISTTYFFKDDESKTDYPIYFEFKVK